MLKEVKLIVAYIISGTSCSQHINVPFGVKFKEKNLSVSPSRVRRVLDTSMYHLVSILKKEQIKFVGVTISYTPGSRHINVPFGVKCENETVKKLSHILRAPGTSMQHLVSRLKKVNKFFGVTISVLSAPGTSLHLSVSSLKEENSKTAVVLIVSVTIQVTSCPRHITLPFGAKTVLGKGNRNCGNTLMPRDPSLSNLNFFMTPAWHRQQSTTLETNRRPPLKPATLLRDFKFFPKTVKLMTPIL